MTDHWIIQDIEKQIAQRNRMVILDPAGQCEFLLPLLDKQGYIVLRTNPALIEEWQTVQEELFLRHEAESRYRNDKVVFYISRELNSLSFLFDYCFTHGFFDLSKPGEWLKKKLFVNTGLQVNMDNPLLLTAAKLGIGKDLSWWKKILQNLEELVSVEQELLPFLNDPEHYFDDKDKDVKRLFEEKIFELLGQPYMSKPPKTLASEVIALIFDKLINNDINDNLAAVYYKWLDSNIYSESLKDSIANYGIDGSVNIWEVHPDHCFETIDLKTLKHLCENLRDINYVKEKLSKLKKRVNSTRAKNYIPCWWKDVITILEFDHKAFAVCTDFEQVISFYTTDFHKVDRAIRNLYSAFLHEENIIRPIQEYYEILVNELLQYWFEFAGAYSSGQQGYLVELMKKAKPGTAVIVGDGLRYEIADYVASSLEKHFKVERNIMLADMPSETEHNMSALYAGNDQLIPVHKEREKKLCELTGREICFMNLEAVNYGINAGLLVLTYKDIDSAGEKLQQGAIKLFDEFERVLIENISLLLKIGYNEVHLLTDHGFVLTGLLDEADKIEPNATGKKEVHERFIRTVEKQNNQDWLCFEKKHGEYNYVYTAKNHKPFKSKGVYGFAHGGFTPQEIIIPNFVFSKKQETTKGLSVSIMNKKELSEVTGEVFGIKIQAATGAGDLFSASRKIQILLYASHINYSSSNIINIDQGVSLSFEFSFAGNAKVQAILTDAETQEQLDSVMINKSGARDLGGLL